MTKIPCPRCEGTGGSCSHCFNGEIEDDGVSPVIIDCTGYFDNEFFNDYKGSPDNEVLAYIVVNENALGYFYKSRNIFYIGVLQASIKISFWRNLDGPHTLIMTDKIRKATKEDFQTYKVSSEGISL